VAKNVGSSGSVASGHMGPKFAHALGAHSDCSPPDHKTADAKGLGDEM